MQRWWRNNGPPVYMSVAGYLGLIPKEGDKNKKQTGDLRELVKMFPGGNISG